MVRSVAQRRVSNTQVGFSRLVHLIMLISGEPEISGPHIRRRLGRPRPSRRTRFASAPPDEGGGKKERDRYAALDLDLRGVSYSSCRPTKPIVLPSLRPLGARSRIMSVPISSSPPRA